MSARHGQTKSLSTMLITPNSLANYRILTLTCYCRN